MKSNQTIRATLWIVVLGVLLGSGWQPQDRFTWFMEVLPVLIGAPVLLWLAPCFRFSQLAVTLLAVHAVVLMIGGHYTYAEVPLFNWLRDTFGLARNHYDRLGHFMQGFVPAIVAREVLLRRGVVRRGPWLSFLVICVCLAISASYELFEWATAALTGTAADAFLGTQGDAWDTQKDMAMALVGAAVAMTFLRATHDRSISRLEIQE
jgi:putative membrane protein